MLEYYFSKRFTVLECNYNNLSKLPNEAKERIHAEGAENSDKVMTYITTIPSTTKNTEELGGKQKHFILPIFEDNSMIKRKY